MSDETKEERETRWQRESDENRAWELEYRELQREEHRARLGYMANIEAINEREQANIFAHREFIEIVFERIAAALEALK